MIPYSMSPVYHCQQAAEKILKGFLTWHDKPFPKTHALVQLLAQATRIDANFDSLQDHAEILSPFAWRFRYPGGLLSPTMEAITPPARHGRRSGSCRHRPSPNRRS